ncbi:SAM-dependent methyltransferase [bacterium]|nr:MAG: SAM-dependent methyltransferase [bacterium]
MKLNTVVPWGRSLDEYKMMFDLSESDLKKSILGCGDGPASFNSEVTAAGGHVISIDPLYAFSAEDIQGRIEETHKSIVSQMKQNLQRYVWTQFKDPDDLGRARLEVMRVFLQDFEKGLTEGRYLTEALPSLSFAENQFELCLCSHLLFLFSEQFSLEFHIESIQELLRVGSEVRIFPIMGLNCQISPYLEPVQQHFRERGYSAEVVQVDYEVQRDGNYMLCLKGQEA